MLDAGPPPTERHDAAHERRRSMWILGGWPLLILVLATGLFAFGAAVSWVAFRTRHAFAVATALAAGALVVAAIGWWRGALAGVSMAAVPFQIAAAVTIGAGLVMVLGDLARGRKSPDDDDDPGDR
jgi:hypothetical protein